MGSWTSFNSDTESQAELRQLDLTLDPAERWFWYCLAFLAIGTVTGLGSYMLDGPNWNSAGIPILIIAFALLGATTCILVMLVYFARYIVLRLGFIGRRLQARENPFPRYWRRPYLPRIILLIVVALGIGPAIYLRALAPGLFVLFLGLVFIVGSRIRSHF